MYKTGDILKATVNSLPIIIHWGVVSVEGDQTFVYHNTPMDTNVVGGSVIHEPLENWLQERTVIAVIPSTLTSKQIQNYANSKAYEQFDLVNFNCEHFISEITTGESWSPQLVFLTVSIVVVLVVLFI